LPAPDPPEPSSLNPPKDGASPALTELDVGTGARAAAYDELAGSDSTILFSVSFCLAGTATTSFAGAGAAADPGADV
jgi:hypothetical protein